MSDSKIRVRLRGKTPLLMHNPRLADPLDHYTKALAQITSRRNRTDEDIEEMRRLEFQGGLHFDEEMGPFIPPLNLRGLLVECGRTARKGPAMERGVTILDFQGSPVEYDGPRDREGLWQDASFRSVLPAKVPSTKAMVMRVRPQFRSWAVTFDLMLNTSQLGLSAFRELVTSEAIGLGDARRIGFGKYTAEVDAV